MIKRLLICYNCGTEVEFERKIFRQATCPECDCYLHCCLNCDNHDPMAPHECRESQAQWARDKETANFCDYFEPVEGANHKVSSAMKRQQDAKSKLEALFKKNDTEG